MEEINGWLATCRKGKINITYKSIRDILVEDIGYPDVIFEEYDLKEIDSDQVDNMDDIDCEESFDVQSSYRRLNSDELFELSNFFTYGKEIVRMGERMTFKVDESRPSVYDDIMFAVANVKVLEC